MQYYDFIRSLALFLLSNKSEADKPIRYAEFGIRRGDTFNRVAPLVDIAYAIDIEDVWKFISRNSNCQWYHMSTDEFVMQLTDEKFDLVFIDADHSYHQSLRDFDNILPYVKDNGFVLLHDTHPATAGLMIPAKCGEAYKTAWDIRTKYGDRCEIVTLPVGYGTSIVRKAHKQLLRYSPLEESQMPKVGVFIGSYDETVKNLEALVKPIKEQGYFIVMGYDAHRYMPSADVVNSCDFFFCRGGWSGGGWGGKQSGELRVLRIGFEFILAQGYDYILKINGDSIVSRPENITNLVQYLGKNDVITSQWRDQCGTMIFFGKAAPLAKIFSNLPEAPPQIEKRFTVALQEYEMKYCIYECRADNQGIWGEVLGFQRGNENYNP